VSADPARGRAEVVDAGRPPRPRDPRDDIDPGDREP
jgi:hypothetical protein